jgi:hypothetical protein
MTRQLYFATCLLLVASGRLHAGDKAQVTALKEQIQQLKEQEKTQVKQIDDKYRSMEEKDHANDRSIRAERDRLSKQKSAAWNNVRNTYDPQFGPIDRDIERLKQDKARLAGEKHQTAGTMRANGQSDDQIRGAEHEFDQRMADAENKIKQLWAHHQDVVHKRDSAYSQIRQGFDSKIKELDAKIKQGQQGAHDAKLKRESEVKTAKAQFHSQIEALEKQLHDLEHDGKQKQTTKSTNKSTSKKSASKQDTSKQDTESKKSK